MSKKSIAISFFCDNCCSTRLYASCKKCNIRMCHKCYHGYNLFEGNLSICAKCLNYSKQLQSTIYTLESLKKKLKKCICCDMAFVLNEYCCYCIV